MAKDITEIPASISFIERARHLDLAELTRLKAEDRPWHGRKDVASLSIGPVTIWIDPTPDGRTTIGVYRQFLDRRQRAELARLGREVADLAREHGLEKQMLAENGSAPHVERN
jgi:hypothetical protein